MLSALNMAIERRNPEGGNTFLAYGAPETTHKSDYQPKVRGSTSNAPALNHLTAIVIRVIEYKLPSGEPSQLFVTLLAPVAYLAKDVVPRYHERCELEIGYDEIKTHMLERKECLRSLGRQYHLTANMIVR